MKMYVSYLGVMLLLVSKTFRIESLNLIYLEIFGFVQDGAHVGGYKMEHTWVGTRWSTCGWVQDGAHVGGYKMEHTWVGTRWSTRGWVQDGAHVGEIGRAHV